MEDSFNLTDFDSLKEAFQVINATSLYLTEENNRFAANNIRLVQDNNYLSQENGQLKENLGIVENKLETVQGDLETVKEDLEKAEQKIAWFTEQIKLARQRQFGRKSEARLNQSNQLNLFDDTEYAEIEVGKENKPEIEVKDGQDEEQAATETITYTRNKPKGKNQGRRIDTSKLPREQIVHDLAEEQKRCGCCGNALEKIGEDVSEQLEYIPAQLKVIEHIRPKYTCRNCNTITTANKPEVPIAKCLAGASLITAVVIGKYEHHLPLYRQSKILLQDGADIPANTLGNWIMEAGEALEPLGEAFWQEIKKTDNLQVDETPVILLNQEKRGYMWCYHSLGEKNKFILFEYNNTRSGEVVKQRLTDYQGYLQSDGYRGYDQIRLKEGIIALGCWAHCRRRFAEVVKISSKAGKAHEALKYVEKLYEIEQEARERKLSYEDRKDLRQEKARPIIMEIENWLQKVVKQVPVESAIGKAVTYAMNQWPYLKIYIEHGKVEIDNNLVENQIRPFALGRKNWLFIGNERAANIAGLFYSLIQTCKINGINPRKYLLYVLNQVGKMRRGVLEASTLLPQYVDKADFG